MEVVGDAGPCGPGTWEIPAVLDLLCLHHLPDTCSFPLALLPAWLCPPFGPSPAQSSSLSPTIASSYFGPLHLSSPRSVALHECLQQHQPMQPVPQEQLLWCWQCCSSVPGSSRMKQQTNKLHHGHSSAPKGNDHWMLLHNPSE